MAMPSGMLCRAMLRVTMDASEDDEAAELEVGDSACNLGEESGAFGGECDCENWNENVGKNIKVGEIDGVVGNETKASSEYDGTLILFL